MAKLKSCWFLLVIVASGLSVSAVFAVPVQPTGQSAEADCFAPRNSSEARAIMASNGMVRRDGCVLMIRAGQNQRRLMDDLRDQGSTYVRYEYQGIIPNTEFHVVAVFFYEGNTYEIIGPGGHARVVGLPILSPDKRRVLTASMDLYAAYNPNALEIWNIERGVPRLEISLRSEEWGPSGAKWIDDQTVEFGQSSLDENSHERERQGAHLHLSDSGWSFEPAPATTAVQK